MRSKSPKPRSPASTVDDPTLQEIVRRIVALAEPKRIILFGSAARGEMGRDSDFDLLVVKEGDFDYGSLLGEIHKALYGVDRAVDVVLVTAEDFRRYHDTHCLVIAPAVREGREVYHAQAVPAMS